MHTDKLGNSLRNNLRPANLRSDLRGTLPTELKNNLLPYLFVHLKDCLYFNLDVRLGDSLGLELPC